jgi:hypothetical protein
MVGFGHDGDNEIEMRSDLLYENDLHKGSGGRETQLRAQSTNMTSMDFKYRDDSSKIGTKMLKKFERQIELSPSMINEEKNVIDTQGSQ